MRKIIAPGLAVLAVATLVAVPATARDRYAARAPLQVAPGVAEPWIVQLAPSSGVVADYRQPLPPRASTNAAGVVVGTTGAALMAPARPAGPAYHPQGGTVAPVRRAATVATVPTRRTTTVASTSARGIDPQFLPQEVDYAGNYAPGTIVIDTGQKFLYHVEADGKARRYGVGVGKPGFEWAGTHKVTAKREWPQWRPPAEMIAREKKRGRDLPAMMDGGPQNPLGARAMYLGSTLYRIHGTNQPSTIGKAMSSGCIRMRNEDVIELYDSVNVGTTVVVL
ncbi:L,D-transpeptidase [Mangrovibrevibacter kandeliae]|uniref:L,D-transpeptidase n=1 Tax=Mangrovibrevibacter kandeliae TaxID=2968473 RepID=UPI0021175525|nr:L,D-transpeptidase [Aurantimonas sp. CSK15Z-1]MCQ8780811.1 L,D-transpeptidase [Aurantimonas sp. CSK15Z-1]